MNRYLLIKEMDSEDVMGMVVLPKNIFVGQVFRTGRGEMSWVQEVTKAEYTSFQEFGLFTKFYWAMRGSSDTYVDLYDPDYYDVEAHKANGGKGHMYKKIYIYPSNETASS